MAQKYYNGAEAAKILGVSPAEINQMVLRRELYGYKDGADWKFKPEDIERVAAERGGGHEEETDNVLASEIELGQSDPGLSGTVIGADKNHSSAESDIHLVEDDAKPAQGKAAGSDLNLLESGIDLASPQTPAEARPGVPGAPGESGAKVSQFEDLDMTLDHDLTLEDSNVAVSPGKPATAAEASEKKLEDDDLVLGGSGTGSDISIGGDSGISLVDPADSGLSLETPLDLSSGEESLELGEDDLLGMASDVGTGSGLKGEDDFQLTPMDDLSDGEDSESGSQVIALDTEGEGDEAATMVASGGTPVAAMLDEDLGGEPGLAAMPLAAAADLGLASPEDALAMGAYGAAGAALPEAPYSIWNIVSLVFVSMLLILVGMMMYELLRNMWGFDKPIKTADFDTWLMDMILGWFEK